MQCQSIRVMINGAGRDARIPKKTAESTGIFPPTPTPTTASNEANVIKLFEPPAASPKIPVISSVKLKDHLPSRYR